MESPDLRSLKALREKERKEKEELIRGKCEALAIERYTEDQVKKWSNANKGLWYMPVVDDNDEIEKLALMRPVTRQILSYASTKTNDEGLYGFLEVVMRECWIEGDKEILEEDEYFNSAAQTLNNMVDAKKVMLLKR